MRKRFPYIPFALLGLLLIPLAAMQFTKEVNWSATDFLLMGALLFVAGTGIEWVLRWKSSPKRKYLFIAVIIILLLLLWMELAVGIFGTPLAGN